MENHEKVIKMSGILDKESNTGSLVRRVLTTHQRITIHLVINVQKWRSIFNFKLISVDFYIALKIHIETLEAIFDISTLLP